MKNKIEAVIFDMDGVLINSEPLWKIAENKVFANVGIHVTNKEMEATVGLRIDEVVNYWKDKFPKCKEATDTIVDAIIFEMKQLISMKGEALLGVESTLKYFKNEGLKIGLATSSYTELLECVLTTLNITDYFDFTLSAEHVEYGKPHPQVYLETAKALAVKAENCLVIEDSYNGMLAGLSAQMIVAVIPEKSHTTNPKLALAHLYFDSLLDLTRYFEEN